jgi:hypothetical protein
MPIAIERQHHSWAIHLEALNPCPRLAGVTSTVPVPDNQADLRCRDHGGQGGWSEFALNDDLVGSTGKFEPFIRETQPDQFMSFH